MKTFLCRARFLCALLLAGTAISAQAANTATVTPSATSYSAAGGNLTLTVNLAYTTSVSGLDFTLTTPAGWKFVSAAGTNVPQTTPSANDLGAGGLGFAYSQFPSESATLTFSFVVSYPAGMTGSQVLSAIQANFTDEATSGTSTVNVPNITIAPSLSAVQSVASKVGTAGAVVFPFVPVTALNGSAPYTWSIAPALPTGLVINAATGAIANTPVNASATTTYTVTITDATTATATNTFSLTVNPALVTTANLASKALTVNSAVTAFVPVTASAGTSPYTYAISPALPTGLAFNSSIGTVSGTPTVASGLTTYTVTATDAANATSFKTFTLAVNSALIATQAIATKVLTGNAAVTTPFIPVTGFGGTPAYAYAISPTLPTGLQFNVTTGAISGTPVSGVPTATYTVTITDANSATAFNSFSLAINSPLTAGQITANKQLTLNTPAVAFTPVLLSGGTAPYTHVISPALPAGLNFNATTGQITGTPTVTYGPVTHTVTISDTNGGQASNTFSLTVNPRPTSTPVAAVVRTVNAGSEPFLVMTVSNFGSISLSQFTYSVTPALPAGLSLNSLSGFVFGAPTSAAATATYTVTYTDSAGATTSQPFTLTVNPAPVATQVIATRTLTAGSAAAPFTPVTVAGGTAPLAFTITPALPTGLTINSATGVISGTAAAGAAATVYTVKATDAFGATATQTFTLGVSGPLGANLIIPSKSTPVGSVVSFTPVTSGGGTAPYVYAVSPLLPAGLAIDAATGAISGTPTTAVVAANYTVTVTDATSATASAVFNLTINPALVATQSVAVKTLTSFTSLPAYKPVVGSFGAPPYTYAVSPALDRFFLVPQTGTIFGDVGFVSTSTSVTYTMTVTDSVNATATNTFTLVINPALVAGTTVAARTLTAGTAATPFTPLALTGGTSPFTWTIDPALPAALAFNTATGQITGTPNAAQVATNYTVTGADVNGAQVTRVLSLTINSALATTQAVATRTLNAGAVATAFTPVTVTAATGTAPYTFTITPALPGGLAIDATTGAISGTPAAASAATIYTVTVTDAVGATSSKTFSLIVNGPLAATQAIATKAVTATTAVTAFTPVTAGGGTTPYVFAVVPALPGGLALSTSTGAITGTATTVSAAATYTVTITDAASGSVNASFNLTVNPALTSTLAVATKGLTVGTAAVAFTPVSATGGTPAYTFSVAPALPAGLSLSGSTGAIAGTPTVAAANANYTLTVTDSVNATTSKVLALTVNAAPTPVAGQTIATKTLTAASNIASFTPLPLNGGTLPFTYTVNPALPTGLSLNPITGAITGNATAAAISAIYTITATDAAGTTATQPLTLLVNPALVATVAVPTKILLINTAATAFTPVTIAGGTAPFTYAVAPTLATGLSFNTTTGAVTGTPTVTTGAVTETVTITDAAGASVQQTFSLKVNQLPAITTPPTAAATYLVGNPLTLTVAANGSPAPTYQWRKGGVDIAGKTTASLVFAALALTDAGSYDVVVTNESGSVTSTPVSFLVYQPPVITTQPANQTIVAGQGATFTIVANGDPAPTYQWRRNGLNLAGATTTTLTLNNVGFDGGGAITVALTNPGGSIVSNAATLTVNSIAPVINSAATATGVVGKNFLFQVTSTATQATYGAPTLPAGLQIIATTGEIVGIPTAAGTTVVNVTATNVTGTDTKTLSITINPAAPVINSAAATSGRVGVPFTFAVLATNTPTAYAATGLPANLAINPTTGAITGTPAVAGTSNVTLSATNAGGTTTSPLQIVIEPPLNAPTFAGSTALSAVQGTAFTFTPAFSGAPFTANFTATGLPTGITLTSVTAGIISGTPAVTGTFTVTITATNAGGVTPVVFTLTVNPASAAPVITSASTAVATVGTPFSFTLTSTGTPVASSYSATGLSSLGLLLTSATGVISGTPTGPGTLTLQVNGTNTVGTGPSSVLVISISPAANASVITSAAVAQGRVGDVFSYTLTASNSPTGFVITSGTLPDGLLIAGGVISGTPTQTGQRHVWFAADNASGRGLAREVLFNIAPASTTPVITSNGTAVAQVGQPFQYTITATNSPTGYAAAGLPDGLSINATTGVISGIPLAPTINALSITLTASKGGETSAPKTLLLTVSPAAGTPIITSSLAATARVGSPFTSTVTASEGPSSFVAANLPDGLTLNAATGILSGTPTKAGTFSSTLRAANTAGLGAPSTLVFIVAPIASSPAITSPAAAGGKVGAVAVFSYQTVATPGPITAYALTGTLPLGLTFNTTTGLLTGRPAESGVFTVQLTATNDAGTSTPQTLVINIAPADNVPIITSSTVAYGTVGSAFSYQITAVGTPAFPAAPFPAPFLLDAINLPPGLAVNSSSGVIEGQPLASGTYVATLVGTNAAGTGAYRDLTIIVQPSANAPVITSPATATVDALGAGVFTYQITATQNPTSFEVLGAPAWLSVNTTTGALSSQLPRVGTYTLQLIARNASGASSPLTLTLTVNISGMPVITSSRIATGKVLTPFSYQITVVRPVGQPLLPLTYATAGLPAGLGIDSATGLISGTPLASGRFEVTLMVKLGGIDCQPVTLVLTIQPSVTFVF